ncbi:MAG: hypothetical protein AVDCRST_MAG47-929 [uncultured Nocardioidaceae bacterium]|uniref:Uncharacterized protein n=1 Tax=uncultured Nocardioidaceae bacterium TaxID=253824 RepID=A0A6J4MU30_9ACTN|nr:MAG: hypothetical protein AVDCRST_MAG47-929 [uncultured Nocardioidaceae bacterium]
MTLLSGSYKTTPVFFVGVAGVIRPQIAGE